MRNVRFQNVVLIAALEKGKYFDQVDSLPLDIASYFIDKLLNIVGVPSLFSRMPFKLIFRIIALLIRVSAINVIIRRGLRKLLWCNFDTKRCSVPLATLIGYSTLDTLPGNNYNNI